MDNQLTLYGSEIARLWYKTHMASDLKMKLDLSKLRPQEKRRLLSFCKTGIVLGSHSSDALLAEALYYQRFCREPARLTVEGGKPLFWHREYPRFGTAVAVMVAAIRLHGSNHYASSRRIFVPDMLVRGQATTAKWITERSLPMDPEEREFLDAFAEKIQRGDVLSLHAKS